MSKCIIFVQSRYLGLFRNILMHTIHPVDIERIYAVDDIKDETVSGYKVCKLESAIDTVEFDIALILADYSEQLRDLINRIYPDISQYKIMSANDMVENLLTREGKMHYLKHWIEMEYPRSDLPFVEIGDFTYFGEIDIMSEIRDGSVKCKIGKFCSIGPGLTVLLGEEHNVAWNTTYPFYDYLSDFNKCCDPTRTKGDVIIGNDVWIGKNVTITSGVEIGTGCVIGAGAVVSRSVEPYSVVVGNPGRVIRKRFSDEKIKYLLDLEWWELPYGEIYNMLPKLMSTEDLSLNGHPS